MGLGKIKRYNSRGITEYYIFLFLCVFQSFNISAQKPDWSPSNREVVITYADSTVRAYILINSVEVITSDKLMYYWYEQDKINRNKGGFAGALLDGPYSVYDLQKNLITQGVFDKGLMVGTWKYWDKKGNLRKTIDYKEGIMHGDYILYDEKGNILEKRTFRNGTEKIEKEKVKEEKEKKEKPRKEPEKQKTEEDQAEPSNME